MTVMGQLDAGRPDRERGRRSPWLALGRGTRVPHCAVVGYRERRSASGGALLWSSREMRAWSRWSGRDGFRWVPLRRG